MSDELNSQRVGGDFISSNSCSITNSSRFMLELRPDGNPGSRLAAGDRTSIAVRSTVEIIAFGTDRIGVRTASTFSETGRSASLGSVTLQFRRTQPNRPKVGDIEIINPPD
ncbi:MAG: hypothetical protein LAT75_00625 [Candidatus Cyclonatronum sp.]|uniref:hypothetical protein n=1 Tax=Cyclonatronum sp. TaxID=3024185 RepID=UPI0025C1AB96|nr:hypothetical protein [Cyclonatronum sp.]MCC5934247.1 hypothetical protein [Balneolales bacterium]MCH8485336.1 hypothetical protein [Cyclonatronum sp.]